MPAASQRGPLTRTQISQGVYPHIEEEVVEYISPFGHWETKVGEVISAVYGAILGEATEIPVRRKGGITYQFDPPRLRTSYAIQYATVNLPPLEASINFEAEPEVFGIEVGWVIGINISGVLSYAEPISAFVGALGTSSVPIPAVTKQFQFTADLDVPPGVTLQVTAIPFIRVTEVKKAGSRNLFLITPNVPGKPIEPIRPATSCLLTYQQSTS